MKMVNKVSVVVLVFAFLLGMVAPSSVSAATTPSLGVASTFGVLSSTFTRNGVTAIIGDLGYTTLSGSGSHTVTGGSTFIGGGAGNATYQQAGIDQGSALTALAAQPCTFTFANGPINLATDTTHGTVGVYTPGVYCTGAGSAASIGTGGIILSGAGTYIFRITGAFTTAANSNVVLANGASSCDVFWTPTAATTLGANTTFAGTVIDNSGITVGNTTSWSGRALAFGGTVTTDTDAITSTCAVAANTSSTSASGPTIFPLINVTKVPNPLSLPLGPGPVTYTYRVTNVGEIPMVDVWVRDNKCGAADFISGDDNDDTVLDLDEEWIYQCTNTVNQTETNIVTAEGSTANGRIRDTAIATVVVGSPIVPPLIHLVKQPDPFVLPLGGGAVTYYYTVTNPGTEPLSNVTITDDKCTGLPGRVVGHPGDLNKNNLLESNEVWYFTCQTNLTQTTTNIGTAAGTANGLTVFDSSPATVVVASSVPFVPLLPRTGFSPFGISWSIIIPAGILGLIALLYFSQKKKIN